MSKQPKILGLEFFLPLKMVGEILPLGGPNLATHVGNGVQNLGTTFLVVKLGTAGYEWPFPLTCQNHQFVSHGGTKIIYNLPAGLT